MFKISKEVRTGILAIVALVIVIVGYNYLKGQNLLDKNRSFYALYENVEGLTPGANVTINGLTVGKVLSIKFADKKGVLKVHFSVVSDFEFSNKSIAKVYGIGFISGKSLAIVPSYEGEPAKDGDILASENENGIVELVSERLEPLQAVI
jgi:phospholipid/cholesterol/gamma-HCH transport system substrate-binding protein